MKIISQFAVNQLPAIEREDGIWVLSPYTKKIIQLPGDRQSANINLPKEYLGTPYPYGPMLNENKAHVTILLTNHCNLECKYCSVCLKSSPGEISSGIIDLSVNFIFEYFKQKEIIISFFGGEPTLAFEMMKKATELLIRKSMELNRIIKFTLTTNGVFKEQVLNFLIDYKFSVLFSLDGPQTVQDLQRPIINGGSSFHQAYPNLCILIKHKINLTVSVTMTEYATKHWEEIFVCLKNAGVKSIQFDPVFPFPWSWASLNQDHRFGRPLAEKYIEAVLSAFREGRKYGIVCSNPVFARLFKPAKYYCDLQAGSQALLINYNGDLLTCAEVQDRKHPIYNEIKIGSLNLDENRFIIGNRESRDNSQYRLDCRECFAAILCSSGCYTRNRLLNNENPSDDFFCKIFQELLSEYMNMMIADVLKRK